MEALSFYTSLRVQSAPLWSEKERPLREKLLRALEHVVEDDPISHALIAVLGLDLDRGA